MAFVRVTKEFNFEIAHALWNYDGDCKNIHGHSYRLFVTILGQPIVNEEDPKTGMVIDFGDLKKLVNKEIVNKLDHSLILNQKAYDALHLENNQMFSKKYIVDYQPTCENMVVDIAEKICRLLPEQLRLFSVKLYETATSYAEWYAEDN